MKKLLAICLSLTFFFLISVFIPETTNAQFTAGCFGGVLTQDQPCVCECGDNAHRVSGDCSNYDFPACGSGSCTCEANQPTDDLPINWNSLFQAIQPNLPGDFPLDFRRGLTIGAIISALLPYIFAIAGFALLIMLIFSGYQYMTSEGDPKKAAAARGRITWAIIGFIVIFAAYWIIILVGRILSIPSSRFPF